MSKIFDLEGGSKLLHILCDLSPPNAALSPCHSRENSFLPPWITLMTARTRPAILKGSGILIKAVIRGLLLRRGYGWMGYAGGATLTFVLTPSWPSLDADLAILAASYHILALQQF